MEEKALKKINIDELLRIKEEEKDGTKGYIDFLKYYYNYGINFYTNKEKMIFYIELQDISVVDSKIVDYSLLSLIDDMCEELDCGSAEANPNYFKEFDKKFIDLFKKYNML